MPIVTIQPTPIRAFRLFALVIMDDVFDDEGVEPTNLTQVEREHSNLGYLAGVTKSKLENHQSGFDEGYIEGAEIGLKVGKIIGTFQALGLHDLELKALKELSARELFSFEYYDKEARPLFKEHPLVVKWESIVKQLANN